MISYGKLIGCYFMTDIVELQPQSFEAIMNRQPSSFNPAEGLSEGLPLQALGDIASRTACQVGGVLSEGANLLPKSLADFNRLSTKSKTGLALATIALLGAFPNPSGNHDNLGTEQASALTSGTVSYRPNGVASLPNGVRNITLSGISSVLDLYAQYRTQYLFECTYDMSQNQFNQAVKANANSSNKNAIALKLISNPKDNFNLYNAVAKKIKNFKLTVPACTLPPFDVRYNKDLSDDSEMDKKVVEIKKLTGCTKVSPNYWLDIVRAINPEHYSPSTIYIPINKILGVFHLGSGDTKYRFPVCRKFDVTKPQDQQGIASKYHIVIDQPFSPQDLYGYYALPRP